MGWLTVANEVKGAAKNSGSVCTSTGLVNFLARPFLTPGRANKNSCLDIDHSMLKSKIQPDVNAQD